MRRVKFFALKRGGKKLRAPRLAQIRKLIGYACLPLALAGCPSAQVPVRIVETIEVQVPVLVRAEPPAELMAPITPDVIPAFVAPSDPAATSALTARGEVDLRVLIETLLGRLDAWRAWAATP